MRRPPEYLKRYPGRELKLPRRAPPRRIVADGGGNYAEVGLRKVCDRGAILRAIQDVERVGPKAYLHALPEEDILRQRELQFRNVSSAKGVPAEIPEGPGSWNGKRGGVYPFARPGSSRRSERYPGHVIRPFLSADREATR